MGVKCRPLSEITNKEDQIDDKEYALFQKARDLLQSIIDSDQTSKDVLLKMLEEDLEER